jgi:hypothetical protein
MAGRRLSVPEARNDPKAMTTARFQTAFSAPFRNSWAAVRAACLALAASLAVASAAEAGGGCAGGGPAEALTPVGVLDDAGLGASAAVAGADVLVGAPWQSQVYVSRRNAFGVNQWTMTLPRPNGIISTSGFGIDIAADNGVAVVGAPFFNSNQGAVVLYTRDAAGAWTVLEMIESPTNQYGYFGMSVALRDGFLVVGAPNKLNAAGDSCGAVFLYGRDTNGKFSPIRRFDPLQAPALQDQYFGWSVSLVNSILCIAAPGEVLSSDSGRQGSVYLYKRDIYGTWNYVSRQKGIEDPSAIFGTDMATGSLTSTGAGTAMFVREQRSGGLADLLCKYLVSEDGVPGVASVSDITRTDRFGFQPAIDSVLCNTIAIHEGFALVGRPSESKCNLYSSAGSWGIVLQVSGSQFSEFGRGVAIGRDQYAIGGPSKSIALNYAPGSVVIGSHIAPRACPDGSSDACEIASAAIGALDRNLDGIPDRCEPVTAPMTMKATQGAYSTGVAVTWPAVQRAYQYRVAKLEGSSETFIADAYTPQYFDTSATAGTQVTYRVRAISGGGDLSGTFTTAVGWKKPATPVLQATNGTSTASVTLTWAAISGANAYEIQRGTGIGSGAVWENLTPVSLPNYVDTTATPGISYGYRVRAKCVFNSDTTAYGDYSTAVIGRIAANMAPLTLSATDRASSSSITLNWTVPTGTPAQYTVLRALGSGKAKVIAAATASGALTYVDSAGLKAGKIYTYTVRLATATSGGLTAQGVMAPVAPSNVQATDGTLATGTTVTWGAAPKATGYYVYRSAAGGVEELRSGLLGKKIGTFTDVSGTPGVTYTYSVRGMSSAGLSVAGSDSGGRNLAAPTSLNATEGQPARITISWVNSTGATGYVVTRTGGGAQRTINTGTSPCIDTEVVAGTVYTYTVKAIAGAYVSLPSASDTGSCVSGFTGSIMAADAGNAQAGKGGHGRTGAQESAEGAAGDEAIAPPHHWLVDGTVVESGLVFFGDEDVVEVKLRDPASTDDMSILFVAGELSLGGRLVLDFGDRVPVAGDRWVILLAGRMSGEFRSVRGIDLPAGLRLEAAVDGPTFSVTVMADDTQQ